jgi:hypothetical protein
VWIVSSTREASALSVGKTPCPVFAIASMQGALWAFRSFCSSSTGSASGRSRLLNWMMCGRLARLFPYSFRFCSRFFSDSRFSWTIAAEESATNTTPSTPCNTSLRVEL